LINDFMGESVAYIFVRTEAVLCGPALIPRVTHSKLGYRKPNRNIQDE